jgi:hypothetical protein
MSADVVAFVRTCADGGQRTVAIASGPQRLDHPKTPASGYRQGAGAGGGTWGNMPKCPDDGARYGGMPWQFMHRGGGHLVRFSR